MPALVLFGSRVCRIGSDDFYYPAFICILCRLLFIILSLVYIFTQKTDHEDDEEHRNDSIIRSYVQVFLILMMTGLVSEYAILHISSIGTMSTPVIRDAYLKYAFLFRSVFVYVAETVVLLYYSILILVIEQQEHVIIFNTLNMKLLTYVLMTSALVLDIIASVVFNILIIVPDKTTRTRTTLRNRISSFGNNDPYSYPEETFEASPISNTYSSEASALLASNNNVSATAIASPMKVALTEEYEASCHNVCSYLSLLTCNLFGGKNSGGSGNHMKTVATMLVSFFYGEPDLVLSDIVAGFMLLSAVQHHEEEQELEEVIVVTSNSENNDDSDLESSLLQLEYYSKYAVGIYGWMLFIWSRPFTGLAKLCWAFVTNNTTTTSSVTGDNLFKGHTIALSLECNASSTIIYASFHNSVCQPAYAVLRDNITNKIVITIRGTLSFEDVLTDVIVKPVMFDDVNEYYAHQGMYLAASWLYRDIITNKALEEIKSQSVIVTGHSMGAGTAVLLCMMLRKEVAPLATCFAYSPPGCVTSSNVNTKSFVTTVVLGKDVIARSSVPRVLKLRNSVLDMIRDAKVSKSVIFSQWCVWKTSEELLEDNSNDHLLNPFQRHLNEYKMNLEERMLREADDSGTHDMILPGVIIHLEKKNHSRCQNGCWVCCRPGSGGVCCTSRRNYDASFADVTKFDNIRISRTMLDDHFPDKVKHVLSDVI